MQAVSVSKLLVLPEGTPEVFALLSSSLGFFLLEMCHRNSQANFNLSISRLAAAGRHCSL